MSTKRVQAFLQLREIGQYYSLTLPSPRMTSPVEAGAKESQSDSNQPHGVSSSADGRQQTVVCVQTNDVEEPVTIDNETMTQPGFSAVSKDAERESGPSTVSVDMRLESGACVSEDREELLESVSVGAAQVCTDIADAATYSCVRPRDRQSQQQSCEDHMIQIRDGFFSWSKPNDQGAISACSGVPKREDSNADPSHNEGDKGRESVYSESASKTEQMLSDIALAIHPVCCGSAPSCHHCPSFPALHEYEYY